MGFCSNPSTNSHELIVFVPSVGRSIILRCASRFLFHTHTHTHTHTPPSFRSMVFWVWWVKTNHVISGSEIGHNSRHSTYQTDGGKPLQILLFPNSLCSRHFFILIREESHPPSFLPSYTAVMGPCRPGGFFLRFFFPLLLVSFFLGMMEVVRGWGCGVVSSWRMEDADGTDGWMDGCKKDLGILEGSLARAVTPPPFSDWDKLALLFS